LSIVDDYLARWQAATARFEAADHEWTEASAEYRAAYFEIQQRNRVVDDLGLPTDQVAPMSRFDLHMLAPLESREAAAWERRKAAGSVLAQAEADLDALRLR
jgi:hypothetical protein